jgi:hypothetical protein
MSYQEEWIAINARIVALNSAATLRAQRHAAGGQESFGLGNLMRRECQEIAELLQIYGATHRNTMPNEATLAIERLLDCRPIQGVRDGNVIHDDRSIPEAVPALVMFAGEMTYIFADRQHWLRLRSQRALEHLQRTLAVNKRVRQEWTEAFDGSGEVECEQLGGVHLLGQGIYAFKIDATGAATDLVFNEPVEPEEAARIGDGLVLTEWKVADNEAEAASMFEQAFAQARIYPVTAMSGLLLRKYRYIIVITEQQMPQEIVDGARRDLNGVVYLPFNIAIRPRGAARQAEMDARRAQREAKEREKELARQARATSRRSRTKSP